MKLALNYRSCLGSLLVIHLIFRSKKAKISDFLYDQVQSCCCSLAVVLTHRFELITMIPPTKGMKGVIIDIIIAVNYSPCPCTKEIVISLLALNNQLKCELCPPEMIHYQLWSCVVLLSHNSQNWSCALVQRLQSTIFSLAAQSFERVVYPRALTSTSIASRCSRCQQLESLV